MSTQPRRRSITVLIISLVVMFGFVSLVVSVLQVRQRETERFQEDEAKHRRQWLDEQLSGLRSHHQSDIYFYCTSETDDLLDHFRDMPEVERLTFELTDITHDGLKVLRTLPNLRELVLYGGRPGVDDTAFGELQGHERLERVQLVNTSVTDGGLAVLKTLPNLKYLTLFREQSRGTTLTDNAVEVLRGMKQLRELELSGGWISTEAVRQLQESLPDCKITTEGDWG